MTDAEWAEIQLHQYEALADETDQQWAERTLDTPEVQAIDDLCSTGIGRAELINRLREIGDLSGSTIQAPRELEEARRHFLNGLTILLQLEEGPRDYPDYFHGVVPRNEWPSAAAKTAIDSIETAQRRFGQHDPKVRKRLMDDLTRFVDKRVRPRGAVGKRKQHEILAMLFAAVTGKRRTAGAQRMNSSRLIQGRKKAKKAKVPPRPKVEIERRKVEGRGLRPEIAEMVARSGGVHKGTWALKDDVLGDNELQEIAVGKRPPPKH